MKVFIKHLIITMDESVQKSAPRNREPINASEEDKG